MTSQTDTIKFESGTYRYYLTQYIAKRVYSVTGIKNSKYYSFKQNTDFILENNEIVWSTLSSRAKPDNNTNFTVIYDYDAVLPIIPFTDEQFGKDIQILQQTNDIISSPSGDLNSVTLKNNFLQAIRHRLLTNRGELYHYPTYGSNLYKLLGQPMSNTNISLAKLYVIETVNQDPRVDKILNIEVTPDRLKNLMKINITLNTIVSHEPMNIIYDFYIEQPGKIYA